jgi:hypothetical protein
MIELTLTSNQKQGQINTDPTMLALIREKFSISNPANRRNSRFIAPRLYAITPSGKFEIGMLKDICSYLDSNQNLYSIKDDLKQNFFVGFDDTIIKQYKLTYRDHQEKSITEAVKRGRGVICIPTAGGKTLIMAGIIESMRLSLGKPNIKALVLVPNIQLVEQTSKDFEEYGMEKVTKWSGDNIPNPDATTVVAGTQILLSEKSDLSLLSKVDVLLIDECLRKNTLVSTIKGNVKIQDLKIGDLVKSFNTKAQKIEYKPVLNTWKNLHKSNSCEEFLEIELENGNIVQLTPNHKIYTDNGYKRADELSENDNILFINSSKWVNLRCKYLYAKTNIQTQLFNMWNRIKICFKTFKIFTPNNNIKTILRQVFKKRIGGLL